MIIKLLYSVMELSTSWQIRSNKNWLVDVSYHEEENLKIHKHQPPINKVMIMDHQFKR